MMEIVHDVAPGAKIFFATAFNGPESFADNIRRLRFEFGCDVIVDDVIYFFESPYQDDIIAQAVDDVTADGALYFSSAGNQGNFDDGTSGTWEGDFKAGGTLAALPSGYTVHDFGGGAVSNRVEVLGGPLILHWSDPGSLDNPLSGNDYDLFVLDPDLTEVQVAATDVQDGDDIPFEFLGFLIPPEFRVVVARHPSAAKRTIRTLLFGGELGISTPGATYGHSQATNAVGVAAVDVAQAEGGEFVGGPSTPVELFSSDGFRRIFYDRNGVPLRGGVSGNGGIVRKKPDVSAADGVSTTLPPFSGLNPFFGTSAAAPHAAAIAGLMKSAVPGATAAKIRASLLGSALDIEGAGRDRDTGTGIATAFGALDRVGARPAVFLELGAVTATPSTGDAILPGIGGTLSISLVNNGGATANAVRGTLFSASPFVIINQASSTFPSVAPGAATTSAAEFEFFVSPSAPCGTKVAFQLAVSFNGRGTSPTLFNFAVQTGRPSATPTTFSYAGAPVAVPDGDGAGVDIPLDVSGTSGISRVSFHIDGATCTSEIGATTVGVDHTWAGDLAFRLISPDGTAVTVLNQGGGPFNDGNNYCQTVLDDDAAVAIADVLPDQAPFTGTFAPTNPQSGFVGDDANGTWTLNVSDLAFFDTGSVRNFSIDVSGFDCTP
jgi:subtilisin-like proprotein convertase family protein